MAQITLNVKDAKLTEMEDAVANLNGYQEQVTDPADPSKTVANPETKTQFVKKVIKNYLQTQLLEYKNRQALNTISSQDNTL